MVIYTQQVQRLLPITTPPLVVITRKANGSPQPAFPASQPPPWLRGFFLHCPLTNESRPATLVYRPHRIPAPSIPS